MTSCTNCQGDLREDAKFCDHCGEKVVPPEPKKLICVQCQRELRDEAKFCDHCGE